MAGFGAERAAVDERALVVGDGVLDQHGVGQVPVDAGEIFKAEFVGAVGAVPRTRFLHLSLRLLARSLGSIFWPDRTTLSPTAPSLRRELFAVLLAADLRCRILTRPPASVRPYIEHRSFCQDQVSLKPNRIGLHAF